MSDLSNKIPVVIHGITGRMGDVARNALCVLNRNGGVCVGDERWQAVPIGVGRDIKRLRDYANGVGLEHYYDSVDAAMDKARQVNPRRQVYHNCVLTGQKVPVMLDVLARLDPAATAVFMEKPLANDYGAGFRLVQALESKRFFNGVVHDFLETPGVHAAIEMVPKIRPLTCQMIFGYEVGAGFSSNDDFRGQRPDFNWTLRGAGGGIILDMSHEAYISRALLGETESLSCVARLLVPRRMSTDRGNNTPIECDVDDYCSIRRLHTSGVVNNSTWTWFRRINSEFGPLEIQIDGQNGSIVFGLYGLKVQWAESAPANLWKDSLAGKRIAWRDYWQYVELEKRNPFAVELERFISSFILGRPYEYNSVCALNIMGEVEALYESAAREGVPVPSQKFLRYPNCPDESWRPERLQGRYGKKKDCG
jgi:predicted dehydrogenase